MCSTKWSLLLGLSWAGNCHLVLVSRLLPDVFRIPGFQLPGASLSSYGQLQYLAVPLSEGTGYFEKTEQILFEPMDFPEIIDSVNNY